jgi:hypothetical protein
VQIGALAAAEWRVATSPQNSCSCCILKAFSTPENSRLPQLNTLQAPATEWLETLQSATKQGQSGGEQAALLQREASLDTAI